MHQSAKSIDPRHFERLRRVNLFVGLAHLIQGAIMLGLSSDLSLPVTASFLTGDPVTSRPAQPEILFELPYGPAVAATLFLAAIDHLLMVTPRINQRYNRHLSRGMNPYRWWEYSVSASLMLVLIAMLVGIWDIGALAAMFGVNTAMIWFGLLMERNQPTGRRADWRAFVFGSVAGAVPWAVIALYAVGGASPPVFVYGIFASLFVFFFSFAVVMFLHYREVEPFRDSLVYEQSYLWLSLGAKSALAWQLFANVLRT